MDGAKKQPEHEASATETLASISIALKEMRDELTRAASERAELRAALGELRELREQDLEELSLSLREMLPESVAARADARRYNFLSCLILAAQNGFGQDVEPFLALCRETWGEEQLWAAVKDLPHGRARREGPARQHAVEPFGFELGPFSAGRTHMMYAAQAGDAARLRWLIARGARLELKDWKGRTALLWASWQGRVETVRELLARGAAVDAAKNEGATPLYIASQNGHLEVVRELLARGAAVDAALNDGFTPLLVASEYGQYQVVRELLTQGATPGLAANDGTTALSLATDGGHFAVTQLLRDALGLS